MINTNEVPFTQFTKIQSKQQEEDEQRYLKNINLQFRDEPNKFIGDFQAEGYKIKRGYIDGKGSQIRLYYTQFMPDIPVCSLCIIHGLSEYSGRYMNLASELVQSKIAVHMVDLRGFGYSGGPRAGNSISDILQDVEVLIQQCNRNIPLFIMGFSMGGLITSSFLINNPNVNIAGAILVNPLVQIPAHRNFNYPKKLFVCSLGDQLKDIVVNNMINVTSLMKCERGVMGVFKDRLLYPFITLKLVKYLVEACEYVQNSAHQFRHPLLMILGEKDGILPFRDAQSFFQKVSSQNKQIVKFPNGYHELQHDYELPDLIKNIKNFVLEQSKTAKPLGNVLGTINVKIPSIRFKLKRKILLLLIGLLVLYKLAKRIMSHPKVKVLLMVLKMI